MRRTDKHLELEVVPLYRSGAMVSSLIGAFGHSLRETRLTAALGYVASLAPNEFNHLFGFVGDTQSVTLEAYQGQDRADIRIKTSRGVGVVEAKVGASNPLAQAFKYDANWRTLLTNYSPNKSQRSRRNIHYVKWAHVAEVIKRLRSKSNGALKFVCADLIRHMEEHNMIRKKESVEIYAREINNEESLNLFLKARIYRCQYQASSRLPEALYFAPHFGRSIANDHPGVKRGISYIARIESVEVADSWGELLSVVRSVRGKTWLNSHIEFLEDSLGKWRKNKGEKRSILFLGKPRLVFNPPVKKDHLQTGKGWLSKRTFSFDELFEGWVQ